MKKHYLFLFILPIFVQAHGWNTSNPGQITYLNDQLGIGTNDPENGKLFEGIINNKDTMKAFNKNAIAVIICLLSALWVQAKEWDGTATTGDVSIGDRPNYLLIFTPSVSPLRRVHGWETRRNIDLMVKKEHYRTSLPA